MKRRIIYKENKTTKETDILCVQLGQLEDIELKIIEMDYETDKEKFERAKKIHIENGKIVFDELYDINKELLNDKEKLEEELIKAQSEIVDLKYNQLLDNKNISQKR